MDRQRLVGVVVLAAVALLGVGLALFAFSGGSKTSTTESGPTAVTPTDIAPAPVTSPGQSSGSQAYDASSFNVILPQGATGVAHTSQDTQDRVTFSLGPMAGAVSSEAARPGEALDEVASLYGPLKGHKTARFGPSPGYSYSAHSHGRFSLVLLGLRKGRLLTVQLVGPASQLKKARTVAARLAATMTPAAG